MQESELKIKDLENKLKDKELSHSSKIKIIDQISSMRSRMKKLQEQSKIENVSDNFKDNFDGFTKILRVISEEDKKFDRYLKRMGELIKAQEQKTSGSSDVNGSQEGKDTVE